MMELNFLFGENKMAQIIIFKFGWTSKKKQCQRHTKNTAIFRNHTHCKSVLNALLFIKRTSNCFFLFSVTSTMHSNNSNFQIVMQI